VLFVVLSVITSLAKQYYGEAGVLVLAGLTGFTDIDPFILSVVSQAASFQSVILAAILIAMMSNTVVKGIYFGVLSKRLRMETTWRYAVWAILHLPIIFLFSG